MRETPKFGRWPVVAAIAVSLVLGGSALAHHGWTGYDNGKELSLTGTIREAAYENPHGFVRLQLDGGKGETWLAVLAPPSRMQARGLAREALKVGATATVVGYPHRSTTDEMRAESITIDGKTVQLR
jgi:hypothetical protein